MRNGFIIIIIKKRGIVRTTTPAFIHQHYLLITAFVSVFEEAETFVAGFMAGVFSFDALASAFTVVSVVALPELVSTLVPVFTSASSFISFFTAWFACAAFLPVLSTLVTVVAFTSAVFVDAAFTVVLVAAIVVVVTAWVLCNAAVVAVALIAVWVVAPTPKPNWPKLTDEINVVRIKADAFWIVFMVFVFY